MVTRDLQAVRSYSIAPKRVSNLGSLRRQGAVAKMPARMLRPITSLRPAERVLLVRLGAVGDVVRSLPALRQIRAAFPGAHLVWLVEDLSAPLLEGHPDLDQVMTLARNDLHRAAGDPRALVRLVGHLHRDLRAARYDVAVDLQSSFKSGVLTGLTGAPRRVGYAPGFCREASFLFTTEWLPLSSPWLNRVERHLEMASALGAPRLHPPPAPLPERVEDGREADAVLARALTQSEPPVVISPGVSRQQSFKAWPPGHYVRLATLIRRTLSLRPLIVWGPGEEDLAGSIVRGAGGDALMAPRTSLNVLAAILRRAAAFVGADTGTMHLAWIVGCPVVALFGPTDPRLNAPWGERHIVLRATSTRMRDLAPELALEALRGVLVGRVPGTAADGPMWGPTAASLPSPA
jgi:lipopolysaccharide heptosyltransferase I